MKYLLDTHLLLWTATEPEILSDAADALIRDDAHEFYFSVVSIWEVAIKFTKHPRSFAFAPDELRSALVERGFIELPFQGLHAIATSTLPFVHRDPFDRALIAQCMAEQITLLTADRVLAGYGPVVLLV